MASTREERLQMRQRGAATRKIKDVDFGFSFGLAPAIEEPSQPALQPTATVPDPPTPPQANPEPENTQPKSWTPQKGLSGPQGQGTVYRSPGSSRNDLPERPSTFDIPQDDASDYERSRKRRKIESPSEVLKTSPNGLNRARRGSSNSQTVQNGNTDISMTQLDNEPANISKTTSGLGGQTPNGASIVVSPPKQDAQIQEQTQQIEEGLQKQQGLEVNGQREEIPITQEGAPLSEDNLRTSSNKNAQGQEDTQQREGQLDVTDKEQQGPAVREEALPSENNLTFPHEPDTRGQEQALQIEDGLQAVQQSEVNGKEQEVPAAQQEALLLEENTTPSNHVDQGPKQAQQDLQVEREPEVNSKEQEVSMTQQERPQPEDTSPPPKERAKRKRGRPKSQADNRPSFKGSATTQSLEEGTTRESKQLPEIPQEQRQNGFKETQNPKVPRERRKRGRPAAAGTLSNENGDAEGKQSLPAEENTQEPQGPRKLPGRKPRGRKPQTGNRTADPGPNVERDVEMDDVRPEPGADSRTREKESDASPPQQLKEKRNRRRAAADSNSQIGATPQSVQGESQPSPPEEQPEPTARELPVPPKRGRGRPSLSSKTGDTQTKPQGEQSAQQEDEGAETRPTRKKTRQPRGDMVPVTVHRLANVTALGAAPESMELSSDEESADELSTRQKTKLPNRGGVNPADVLSQICRETLEKTLTTLKNGIANESNAARRSEWTRKKKVVEAYGSELEGRLFELSEILDSNFILGVQLRKSKREMMDLRSRLHQVRKERESVALQMDAVRRKHAEEEDARMARGTINNSLHSLELALERSQNRSAADEENDSPSSSETATTPAAGLEFLLRSVAENVSCSTPGAHGGLLNQIKAFNAQLEATAQRLEG